MIFMCFHCVFIARRVIARPLQQIGPHGLAAATGQRLVVECHGDARAHGGVDVAGAVRREEEDASESPPRAMRRS